MSNHEFIEDIFLEFWTRYSQKFNRNLDPDYSIYENFYFYCLDEKPLTDKQGKFIVRILKKFEASICDHQFNYRDNLVFPKFKKPFRPIDLSKKIFVDIDEKFNIVLCLKFPHSFKDKFDREFGQEKNFPYFSQWDPVRQARIIDLFSVNILRISEFVKENRFELDQSFLHLLAEYEHAVENQETYLPKSSIVENKVTLSNCDKNIIEYFSSIRKDDVYKDSFIAKTMGYPLSLEGSSKNIAEQISSSKETRFWAKNLHDLFELYVILREKICIIIDRNEDSKVWLSRFIDESLKYPISRSKIKICFRQNKDQGNDFNDWIKDNDLGGKIDDADILIFEHKPAKWVFKEDNFIKILVTTMINPSTHSVTGDWLETHPCVIYLADIRPTIKGNKKIVQL